MNNLDGLRLRLSDQYKNVTESWAADGIHSVFDMSHYPLRSGTAYCSVYIDTVLQTATAAYSLSYDDGRLTLSTVPASGDIVEVVGRKSVFSDTELSQVLADHGAATGSALSSLDGLDAPVLTCVDILCGDAWKRASWAAAGGQSVSEGQLMGNLLQWRKSLIDKQRGAEVGPAGGFVPWAQSQDEYGDDFAG